MPAVSPSTLYVVLRIRLATWVHAESLEFLPNISIVYPTRLEPPTALLRIHDNVTLLSVFLIICGFPMKRNQMKIFFKIFHLNDYEEKWKLLVRNLQRIDSLIFFFAARLRCLRWWFCESTIRCDSKFCKKNTKLFCFSLLNCVINKIKLFHVYFFPSRSQLDVDWEEDDEVFCEGNEAFFSCWIT